MPRVVNHEERREEIAEAAWRVIERCGTAGTNLRKIAGEAGYTTGVITHYFRNKRQLMVFAFGLLVDRSTSRMAEAVREAGVVAALAQVLPLDEERRRETTVWLSLLGASLTDPDLASELRERYRRAREATLPMFKSVLPEKAQENGPDDVADEILAVVDGITVDALTDPERYPPGRQLELLRRALARLGLPAETSEDELG
jgi:TetR/AcrR family transcriptional regulator, transcriptional repressor of bet genes